SKVVMVEGKIVRSRGEGARLKCVFFFQAEDGIRDRNVTGVQTCALPISNSTEMQTRTPAITPMITEATGLTKPEGAVIATRPASKPLPLIDASGLPYRSHI